MSVCSFAPGFCLAPRMSCCLFRSRPDPRGARGATPPAPVPPSALGFAGFLAQEAGPSPAIFSIPSWLPPPSTGHLGCHDHPGTGLLPSRAQWALLRAPPAGLSPPPARQRPPRVRQDSSLPTSTRRRRWTSAWVWAGTSITGWPVGRPGPGAQQLELPLPHPQCTAWSLLSRRMVTTRGRGGMARRPSPAPPGGATSSSSPAGRRSVRPPRKPSRCVQNPTTTPASLGAHQQARGGGGEGERV